MLNPPDPAYLPPVSAQAALDAALRHTAIGPKAPRSITARLALFGSGDPVWVITFRDICPPTPGGPAPIPGTVTQSLAPCPIKKLSAVVNAGSGKWTDTYGSG